MFLAIDVGNSNIVIGLMEGRRVLHSMRSSTSLERTSDEYAFQLMEFCSLCRVDHTAIQGAILSSVVPKLKRGFREAVSRAFGLDVMVVGPGVRSGLNICIDQPAELGSDLVVDAVAALELYGAPLAVIDMGTATTISVLDPGKRYIGGLIIPGMSIASEALARRTSQLRRIALEAPVRIIGRNTGDCMRSGAVYGHAAMLDGLLDRLEESCGYPLTAVITGGLAPEVYPHCRHSLHYEADLMLIGLALIRERNT